MTFSASFLIITLLAFGWKLKRILLCIRQKNTSGLKAESFLFSLMLLTLAGLYFILK